MSERGGRERSSSKGGSLGLVAEIWEVQSRSGGAGRQIWKGKTLHGRRDGGEGKRRRAGRLGQRAGQRAGQVGSCLVLVEERLSSDWSRIHRKHVGVEKCCLAVIAGLSSSS